MNRRPPPLDADALAPDHRYRVYVRSGELDYPEAFCPDMASVGSAIGSLDQDARDAGLRGLVDRGMVGVYDSAEGRWVILPWPRGGP